MKPYAEIARPASWTLLAVTLGVALLIGCMPLLASAFAFFVMHAVEPGLRFRFDRILWVAVAVLVPAVLPARFYLVVATGQPSARSARFGWAASAFYHGAVAIVSAVFAPGAFLTIGDGPKLPLPLLSAAACGASVYLLVKYLRQSRLESRGGDAPISVLAKQ